MPGKEGGFQMLSDGSIHARYRALSISKCRSVYASLTITSLPLTPREPMWA